MTFGPIFKIVLLRVKVNMNSEVFIFIMGYFMYFYYGVFHTCIFIMGYIGKGFYKSTLYKDSSSLYIKIEIIIKIRDALDGWIDGFFNLIIW